MSNYRSIHGTPDNLMGGNAALSDIYKGTSFHRGEIQRYRFCRLPEIDHRQDETYTSVRLYRRRAKHSTTTNFLLNSNET